MVLTLLVFLLILTVLVIIHEAGHYFVAKKLGIKVEEFGFGFPPQALSIKKGETVYSINWLPLGGFVKLFGEDEAGGGRIASPKSQTPNNKDIKRAFFARPVWQRASVVVAGVIMNAILAAVIFYAFLGISNYRVDLPLMTDHKFVLVNQKNYNLNTPDVVVSAVSKDSPAEKAGMVAPVKVLSVDNKTIADRKSFIDYVNKHKGNSLLITWQELKTDKVVQAFITPRVSPPKDEGPLGVGFFPMALLRYDTPTQRLFSGFSHAYNVTAYTVDIMSRLFAVSVEKKSAGPVSEGVSGPVGIVALVDQILKEPQLKEKVLGVLNLAGLLSISLAFFNILPIPALDGGRLFFILLEGVTGKKINQRYESLAHTIGMLVLLTLIVAITFRDVVRLFIK